MRGTEIVAGICFILALAATLFAVPESDQGQAKMVSLNPQGFAGTIAVGDVKIDTKAYLEQAWSVKGRPGFVANTGLAWDAGSRQWTVPSKVPDETLKGIAQYASFTEPAARLAVNVAQTYHDLDLTDELAKFYSVFLKNYFVTLGQLRKMQGPEIKQKMLSPELGPDSLRTLPWHWKQGDGSVILRDCYLCNAYYFYHAARLIRVIALLKPGERTPAMNQFVAEYVPLLAKEHVLRACAKTWIPKISIRRRW
jgi:hypothetical protein